MKDTIVGIVSMVIGSLFLLGCIYNMYTFILIAIELNDLYYAFGFIVGSGIIGLLGFFLVKYGFKKYNASKACIST